MVTVLCSEFIQDTVCQLLSESAEFRRRYDKNILAYFFLGHGVVSKRKNLSELLLSTLNDDG